MGPGHTIGSLGADRKARLDKRAENEMQGAMRQYSPSLKAFALATLLLLLESFSAISAEDPADWSFKNYDKFMANHFQASPEMRSGERISILIFGDYQCETRLVLARLDTAIRAEVVVAVGSSVRDQLSALRLQDPKATDEEVFSHVRIERQLVSSKQIPSLSDLWQRLRVLRLPVLPDSGFISPAVWYQVSAISGAEHHFEFAVPVAHAPNTGHLGNQSRLDYPLAAWVRSVLTTLGGRAARAADGGDCAVNTPLDRHTGAM